MIDVLAVVALGAAIGASELLTRYTADPAVVFRSVSSWVYLALNALVAWLALEALELLWTPEKEGVLEHVQRVLVAGLGAMAVLRASVMTIRVQGQDISVGPAAIVQVFMNVADRSTDRHVAKAKAPIVGRLVKGVSFKRSHETLPTACFTLMNNVSGEEQKILGDQITSLLNAEMPDRAKTLIMGLRLLDIVGEQVLKEAVSMLGEDITEP